MIDGSILIGNADRRSTTLFHGVNPATGEQLPQGFCEASSTDVADACALAAQAAESFAGLSPTMRADFIEAAAEAILNIGDILIETAIAESGLPRARLEGERMRTVNQLRLFASEVRDGTWLDVTIDPALPDRTPPRSDLRRMNHALGPVAVFGASNFPLAFSVAGGDTASALAAGCPVVVKGHPAHPATGELVARAIRSAVQACDLAEGVFSFLPGQSNDLGGALVADPRIKAVGFTGSRGGGLALVAIAAKRAEPIPVYAEMASINPVMLMPAALDARAEALGAAFVGSLTMGAGQFCTNPGLVIALDSPALDRFVSAASEALSAVEPPVMLTPGIHTAYQAGVAALDASDVAKRSGSGQASTAPNRCSGALFETTDVAFVAEKALGHEVFGASAVIVRCASMAAMLGVIASLEGQLTATLQMDSADEAHAATLLPLLAGKVGRVLANGWPTGVEVSHAMVHGGPFPSTIRRTDNLGRHAGDDALSASGLLSGYCRCPTATAGAGREPVETTAPNRRQAGDGMMRSLIQFAQGGARGVAALDAAGQAYKLNDTTSTLALAHEALAQGTGLADLANTRRGAALDLAGVTLLSSIDHVDPAHLLVSGTGLTHLGSAEGRDKMHKAAAAGAATDSMRMFLEGAEGGKPAPGQTGQQPEWFYKGDGSILVAPGTPLHRPGFAQDGGEEPEIAGIYVIDANGTPVRLGFTLGNEFSDHVTERHNYLWLAHSKLRQAALGPELLLGSLPEDIRGTSRIIRGGAILWEKPFLSGEANMSHSIANLEHHHFKYAQFRRAGDVHVHFFGTATLSFADGIETQEGDVFEVSADAFTLPVSNPLVYGPQDGIVAVRIL